MAEIDVNDKKRRFTSKQLPMALSIPSMFHQQYSNGVHKKEYSDINAFVEELEEAIQMLRAVEEVFNEMGYEDITLFSYHEEQYYNGKRQPVVYFRASVIESDAQYLARITREEKAAERKRKKVEAQKKRDMEQLKKLKEKYGEK